MQRSRDRRIGIRRPNLLSEDFKHRRREDVHTEECKIISSTQAGNNHTLFRLRRCRFFDDGVDLIQGALLVHGYPADDAKAR
jgi:hypothetical protein